MYSDFSLIVHPVNCPYPVIVHPDFQVNQVPKYMYMYVDLWIVWFYSASVTLVILEVHVV